MTRRATRVPARVALCAALAAGACLGPLDGASFDAADGGPSLAASREPIWVAALAPLERRRIERMSPLPDPPPDPTNAVADDPRAARLGQALFFDPRLSDDGSVACVTCHDPSLGWSDGRRLARGLADTDRNAPTLWNVAYQRWFFWDGRADSLWAQALGPLENPKEHGADRVLVARVVHDDARLAAAYEEVFGALPELDDATRFPARARPVPDDPRHPHQLAWDGMSPDDRVAIERVFTNVGKSIAAFERRITSRSAPIDVFVAGLRDGDPSKLAALDEAAVRGAQLFVGRGNCHVCHGGATFSDLEFHDVRLPPAGASPFGEPGRLGAYRKLWADPFAGGGAYSDDPLAGGDKIRTLLPSEEAFGAFKTPSLRNVAVTGPYMHRGHFETLDEVLDHYSTLARGGPPVGHHVAARRSETILVPLRLTTRERDDLRAFLEALTDTAIDDALLRPPPGLEPPPPRPRARTLDDFRALSDAALAERPLEELAGLDRVRGWRLRRDLERALAEPGSTRFKEPLFLPGVETLTAREAEELARFDGGRVFLRDLRALDLDAARALAGLRPGGELFLDGIATLDVEVAAELAAWPGDRLSFGGLAELPPALAATLADFGGGLELDGLGALELDAARALSTWDASGPGRMLTLDGLAALDAPTAFALAGVGGWGLSLGGLATLDAAIAEALVPADVTLLRLDGVTRVDPDAVGAMTRWTAHFAELRGLAGADDALRARLDAAPTVFSLDPPQDG